VTEERIRQLAKLFVVYLRAHQTGDWDIAVQAQGKLGDLGVVVQFPIEDKEPARAQ